jgi:hypothetical protein
MRGALKICEMRRVTRKQTQNKKIRSANNFFRAVQILIITIDTVS